MKITNVRLNEQEGREALEKYVLGGHYGPIRVPRGVQPELVSKFINDNVTAKTDAEDFPKALEVLRYYERADVLGPFAPLITGRPADREDFQHQAVVCQMFGDLGGTEGADRAAAHLNRVLAPHQESIGLSALVLETLLVLAPAGSPDPYAARVSAEADRLAPDQRKSEADMMAYDRIAAIKRNDMPRIRKLIEFKNKLAAQNPAERRHALVNLYFGLEAVSHPYLQMWAARMLRLEAMTADPAPARAEFKKIIADTPPQLIGKDKNVDAVLVRAFRALQYFDGKPTDAEQAAFAGAKTKTLDFLDDSI